MTRLVLVLAMSSAANACAWNIKSKGPAIPAAPAHPASPSPGPRTYSLTGEMPAEYRRILDLHLSRAGFSQRQAQASAENELHLGLHLRWSLGGRPRLRFAACVATLNLLPCWGTVNLRVEATATRGGAERRYEFSHRYRKFLWLLPFALAASKPGQPASIAELGANELQVVDIVIGESVEHLSALLRADGLAGYP